MASQTITVHDLHREFAKLEAEGRLDKVANFKKRRWVWCEDNFPLELEMTPPHGCWPNLTRIGMGAESWSSQQDARSLEWIEWRYCSNIVILKLVRLDRLPANFNLAALKCLKSMELIDITSLDSLDGLQDLKNFTYFRWIHYDDTIKVVHTRMGRFPSSLKILQLSVEVWLGPDVFADCTNLSKLELYHCETADNLDFSNCSSLRSVRLVSLPLRTLTGLSAVSSLQVSLCLNLLEIPGLDQLVGLQQLHLTWNVKFVKLPDLQKLTRLQVLKFDRMEFGGLGCLQQLRELECTYLPCSVLKLPNLRGFAQLQAVDFSCSRNLSSLEGVFAGDLSALRSLNLHNCASLIRLPDLSGLRNLEELDLSASGIELRVEDICMLATLPLLRPWWLKHGTLRSG